MIIKVYFSTIDRCRWTKSFKSVKGARAAIIKQLGQPEVGSTYAVSGDGICKVQVAGDATLRDLFPIVEPQPQAVGITEEFRAAREYAKTFPTT